MSSDQTLFRPNVQRMSAYLPGEQPQEAGWTKLNTNENPYPPSPRVIEAIEQAASDRLRIYPDPTGKSFRRAAGELYGLDPDAFLPANGSDENLTILLRAFCDADDLVALPYPSYILYETLADIQGCRCERVILNPDWSWDLEAAREVAGRAKLFFIPNPNSPSGNVWDDETILSLVPPRGILVLDEAYGDFRQTPHRMELLRGPEGRRIVVTRTFSKSYSLAGLRLGYAAAHPDLIAGMQKVKDSYNCDILALAGGEAAIRDQDWMQQNVAKIRQTRSRAAAALRDLGFHVVDSQANFLWTTHPGGAHETIYQRLKDRRILVRWMRFPAAGVEGLRITIGTDAEIDTLLAALREIVEDL